MKRIEPIINNELYHVINRGTEKRNIFIDNDDYLRFINSLIKFNDKNYRHKLITIKPDHLVKIYAFCLMPNHFHLLLRQVSENGIEKFIQKVSMGYANYFNLKYQRTGTLFQGRYKAILIKNRTHFEHIIRYIHFNPLDLQNIDWRGGIKQKYYQIKSLLNYPWSSHQLYLHRAQSKLVSMQNILENFPLRTDYINYLKAWCG